MAPPLQAHLSSTLQRLTIIRTYHLYMQKSLGMSKVPDGLLKTLASYRLEISLIKAQLEATTATPGRDLAKLLADKKLLDQLMTLVKECEDLDRRIVGSMAVIVWGVLEIAGEETF